MSEDMSGWDLEALQARLAQVAAERRQVLIDYVADLKRALTWVGHAQDHAGTLARAADEATLSEAHALLAALHARVRQEGRDHAPHG